MHPAYDFYEMTLDHVAVAGFDGYLKSVSPSWTRTLGWSAEELTSRPSIEFVHPDDRAATLAGRGRLKSGLALGPLVNRYLCKDGSFRWFEWRSVAHAERALVYASARDVTDQKLAEARLAEATERQEVLQRQLAYAERMASVGTLAAGLAHEINNPLAAVSANIDMIIDELDKLRGLTPWTLQELREMAVDVQAGAERIRRIVAGMRSFAHHEEDQRTALDVRGVLATAIDMTRHAVSRRARLVEELGDIPLIDGDPGRLAQVFVNLIVNAAQAMPDAPDANGAIHIATSTGPDGSALVRVRDTGSGIPAAILGRVFDPFFTTKPVGAGTGLGLSMSRNILVALGGDLTVESEPGVGTTFTVRIPPSRRPPPTETTSTSRASGRATVLVVDDEPAVGVTLCRLLRGHDVVAVTSAPDALAILKSGRRFDLILSDMTMPGMSGVEFYGRLEAQFPDVVARVVFASGGAFGAEAEAFLERVPNALLTKPFDTQLLREVVQRAAESRAS